MRILFDQAVYSMRNKGNIALLQIALRRIHQLWPEASLEVMTEPPHILKLYCPEAFPVSIDGRYNWSKNRKKFENFHRLMPRLMLRSLLETREEMLYRGLTPGQVKQHLRTLLKQSDNPHDWEDQVLVESEFQPSDPPDLEEAMLGADMVIGTGGGYLGDSDWGPNHPILLRLAKAKRMGKFRTPIVAVCEHPTRGIGQQLFGNRHFMDISWGNSQSDNDPRPADMKMHAYTEEGLSSHLIMAIG